jgi:parvulin-like peptidyl-prolyl isomerase
VTLKQGSPRRSVRRRRRASLRRWLPGLLRIAVVAGLAGGYARYRLLEAEERLRALTARPHAEEVLARVDGEAITVGDFVRRESVTNPLFAEGDLAAPGSLRNAVLRLDELIDRAVALREAEKRGIAVGEEELAAFLAPLEDEEDAFEVMDRPGLSEREEALWRRAIREDLVLMELFQAVAAEGEEVVVDEEQIAAEYERNRARYQRPEMVKTRRIVCRTREDAETVLEKLRKRYRFETLAKRYSLLDPEESDPLEEEFRPLSDYPQDVIEVLETMDVGQTSEVLETEGTYQIYQLLGRRHGESVPLEEAREEIRRSLISQERLRRFRKWLKSARSNHSIELYLEVLVRTVEKSE